MTLMNLKQRLVTSPHMGVRTQLYTWSYSNEVFSTLDQLGAMYLH